MKEELNLKELSNYLIYKTSSMPTKFHLSQNSPKTSPRLFSLITDQLFSYLLEMMKDHNKLKLNSKLLLNN